MSSFSFRKILLLLIWGIHLCFFSILLLQPSFSSKRKAHKSLIVNTITPKPVRAVPTPSKKIASPTPARSIASPPKPAKTQSPSSAKSPVKKAMAKAPSSPKKEPAIADKTLNNTKKASAPPRATLSEALRKEIEESIAKIEQKGDKKKENSMGLKSQTAPVVLRIDTESEEDDYIGILVGHLHQLLVLPEYGEVKIRLSLRQDGSVVKLAVLNAQSKENRRYLETTLPHMRFPKLNGAYTNQKECDFILTFLNEN